MSPAFESRCDAVVIQEIDIQGPEGPSGYMYYLTFLHDDGLVSDALGDVFFSMTAR